ncbi:hypothetical protein PGT21_005628 [Puccinia graminis f. sp. tritici]|uniref:Uncharacterized protein n=1 Tax=Puccinia graminis f. sp. tritici TaxID=56615 RepID=A0A5B0NGH6_PUCGR|nr:hypothetical protein PGTUg99_024915 [Puccinia graminis f. sp. tritici]KAA1105393.1 hypothetical protein PGT21_005628 [Puccinia graminis f. sp. tritici]
MEEVVKKTPELDYYQRDLHLELLIGLDLDRESLRRVQKTIRLTNQEPQSGPLQPNARWEPLRVELWSGDLAVNNERFKILECVVMTVEEYLADELVDQVLPRNEILEHVKQYLVANEIFRVRLRELWLCDQGLNLLCAGRLYPARPRLR